MDTQRDEIGELLHGLGLRSTPQRRAIMAAVSESGGEHLSADEVHTRASLAMPGLGRGTVYATLAELSERGALGAVGLPEPVRYEANTAPHGHFRCRLCLRLFDLDSDLSELDHLVEDRFVVERVTMRAEGICEECVEYKAGLMAGIDEIHGSGEVPPWYELIDRRELACVRSQGPLGIVLLAATPSGLARLAFEDQGDAPELLERSVSRRGSHAAREHLRAAKLALESFLAGDSRTVECTVDPAVLAGAGEALQATQAIPYASHRSYTKLGLSLSPRETGTWMGANPLPVVFPCHRVSRGEEVPQAFVGGLERRRWLEDHERENLET